MKKCRILSMVLCLVMVLSLFTGFAGTASADNNVIEYTVKQDDYLFKICKANGLDFYQCKQAIMALNGFTSEQQLNRISVGQKIKLPASNAVAASVKTSSVTTTTIATTTTVGGKATTTTTTSTVAGTPAAAAAAFYLTPHVINNGETLVAICNTLGTNYNTYSSMILAMNGITNPNNIKVGKTVYIPTSTAPATGGYAVVAHTVSAGENLTGICSQYGTNYGNAAQLVSGLNTGKDISKINAGQTVYVPVATTAATSAGVTTVVPTTAPASTGTGYSITFNSPENGSAQAAVKKSIVTKAEAGSKVTVVPTANEGYALKSVSVIRLDTSANVVVNDEDYTFTMPKSDVKITVTFADAYKITKASADNGSFEFYVNGAAERYAHYGDLITVDPTPKAGYAVAKVTYGKVGETGKTVNKNSSGAYKFNMPNYAVKITVTFEPAEYFKLNAKKTGSGTVRFTVNGTEATVASEGSKVYVYTNPDKNYTLNSKSLINTKTNAKVKLTKEKAGVYYFTMPDADVQFTAEFVRTNTYKLINNAQPNGKIAFFVKDQYSGDISRDATEAKAGDTVIIITEPSSGYRFNPDKTKVTYANGNSKVALDGYNDFGLASGYSFTMPTADVTVTPAWAKNNVTRYAVHTTKVEHGDMGIYCDDGNGNYVRESTSMEGKTVKVHAKMEDGYVISKAVVTYGGKDHEMTKVDDSTYTFKMPKSDVTVSFVTRRSTKYVPLTTEVTKIDKVTPGSISARVSGAKLSGDASDANSNVLRGSTVNITVSAKDGYELDTLKVNGKTLKANSDGSFSYVVATADTKVEIVAAFTAKKYTIMYSSPSHGTYTIKAGTEAAVSDNVRAHAGDKIVIEATPASGFAIGKMIIDGVDHKVEMSGSTYTFTMPAAKVITQVTFVEDAAAKAAEEAAKQAEQKAAADKAAADAAKSSAASAISAAQSAISAVENLMSGVTTYAQAQEALSKATTAVGNAESAQTEANKALTSAANTTDADAKTQATNAVNKAAEAKAKADAAKSAAQAAVDSAHSVSFTTSEDGLSVSADISKALPGETVTVTVTVDNAKGGDYLYTTYKAVCADPVLEFHDYGYTISQTFSMGDADVSGTITVTTP